MLTKLAIILTTASILYSGILTGIVRLICLRTGFVARPVKDRYHQTIVPLGGGIAIFATITTAIIASIIIAKFFLQTGCLDFLGPSVTIHTQGLLTKIPQLLIVVLCMTILFAVGLYDDKKHLSPLAKLTAQLIVAFIAAAFADIRVEFFIHNRIITIFLSALWITLLINVFNFLDNMDGVSAGIAAIATAVLLIPAVIAGQIFVATMAILLIGTLIGFLIFNFPPAKIFMGDAGSMIIGFFVALLTLKTTYYNQANNQQWFAVFLPLIVVAVPLYDFASVTFLRIKQGKSPFIGDTQHFSHRLKKRGLSDTQTALTLYMATLCTSCGALFLYQVNTFGALAIIAQTAMILSIIAILESTGKNEKPSNQ